MARSDRSWVRALHGGIAAAVGFFIVWADAGSAAADARAAGDGASAAEISECARSNLPERTSHQEIELESLDRAGGRRTLEAQLDWKRGDPDEPRVRIRIDAPTDLRGAAYLVIERPGDDDMFMYLPAARRVRRIAAGMLEGQLWGTDFSYEDIKQIQGIMAGGTEERLADADVAGRIVWVLAHRPERPESSAYTRIVVYVDRTTCVALRTEFFQRGEKPRKVLLADPASVVESGGRWMARELEMIDQRDGTRSWLRVLKVEYDVDIPDSLFSTKRLGTGR